MPINAVKTPEQEQLWQRAKVQAAKQGHTDDWPYIMSIYQKMAGLSKGMPTMMLTRLPRTRIPGQVPTREQIELIRLVKEQPPEMSVARLLDQDGPRPTVTSILGDLGLDAVQYQDWSKFLGEVVRSATNEVTLRQDIMSKCLNERLDGGLRRAILLRSLVHWRSLRKGLVQVVTVGDLQKAVSPGGAYHRRVPKPGGGYRYFYDEDRYVNSKGAHTGGAENAERYIHAQIQKCIEKSGKAGCGVEAFKSLVQKYGAKTVGAVLSKNHGKTFEFRKGKFMMSGTNKAVPVQRSVSKSELFIIPENWNNAELRKGGPHKYISRKRDSHGNWVYTYPEDLKKRIVNAILDFLSNPKRELTVGQAARSFRVDKPVALEAFRELERQGKVQKKGDAWVGKQAGQVQRLEQKGAKEPDKAELIAFLKKHPGYSLTTMELAYSHKIHSSKAKAFLDRMVKEGVLAVRRNDQTRGGAVNKYYATEAIIGKPLVEARGLHAGSTPEEVAKVAETLGREHFKNKGQLSPASHPDFLDIMRALGFTTPEGQKAYERTTGFPVRAAQSAYKDGFARGWWAAQKEAPKAKLPEPITDTSKLNSAERYMLWRRLPNGDWILERSFLGSYLKTVEQKEIERASYGIFPMNVDPNKPVAPEKPKREGWKGTQQEWEKKITELAEQAGLHGYALRVGHKPGGGAITSQEFNVPLSPKYLIDAYGKNPSAEKVSAFLKDASEIIASQYLGTTTPAIVRDDIALAVKRSGVNASDAIKTIDAACQKITTAFEAGNDDWSGQVKALELLVHHFGKEKKEQPKLVIPKEEQKARPGEQLGLFDRPKTPVDDQAAKSVEENVDKVVEQVQKPDKTAVSDEKVENFNPPIADDPTLAFPLSAKQVNMLRLAASPEYLGIAGVGAEEAFLLQHEFLSEVSVRGKFRLYTLSKLGRQWLAKEDAKAPAEKTPENATRVQAEKKAKETIKRETKGKGSRRKLAVEQGDHVWGSRADRFAEINTAEDLAKLAPEDQARYATKTYLCPPIDLEATVNQGKTPGYALLRKAVESCVQSKSGNSLQARQLYMEGTTFIRKSLEAAKTEHDVIDFISEFNYLMHGQRPGPRFTNKELEQIKDEWVLARKGKLEYDWRAREQLKKEQDAAWKELYDKKTVLTVEQRKEVYARYDAARTKLWRVAIVEPVNSVIAWKLKMSAYDVGAISTKDGYRTYLRDPSLPSAVRDNPYAKMAAGLGTKFIKLVASAYPGGNKPKVWTDAIHKVRDWERGNVSEEKRIEELYEYFKTGPRKTDGKARYKWELEVSGEINRKGGDPVESADPQALADEFGFTNVQFGNWVTEEDAQTHIKGAHGALRDLADLMGIDRENISLNGRLAIGFGARGSGNARAHYEPSRHIINITKIAGGGSLAHEWAHAMDNIMAKAWNPGSTKAGMNITEGDTTGVPQEVVAAVNNVMNVIRFGGEDNPEEKQKFDALMAKYRSGQKLSYYERYMMRDYSKRLVKQSTTFYQDAVTMGEYWSRRHEMFARCFAVYAEDALAEQGRKSTYLTDGTTKRYATFKFRDKAAADAKDHAQPFPHGEERKRINAAIAKLVKVIAETQALQKALQRLYILR